MAEFPHRETARKSFHDIFIQLSWKTNHKITLYTLEEDFEIAEQIQRGIGAPKIDHLKFGRNESALRMFNAIVDELLQVVAG